MIEYQYLYQEYLHVQDLDSANSRFLLPLLEDLPELHQEDNLNKQYKVFSPRIVVYYAIVAIILIILRDYNIRDYEIVRNAFIKLATIVNAITATILIFIFKARAIFYNW